MVERGRLLQELKSELRHACELVAVAGIEPLVADEVEEFEYEGDDLVRVRDPRLGGPDRDPERREVRMRDSGSRAQALRPPPILERREQAAPAFVADEMRDEGERLGPVVRPEGRDREREGESPGLADRDDVEPRRKEALPKERGVDVKTFHGPPLHRLEPGPDVALEIFERLAAEDHELHQVGGIGALVEVAHLVAEVDAGALGERLLGPDVESSEGMPWVEGLLPRREAPQVVAPAPRHELGVDDPALTREVPAVEPRGNEELGEAVERAFKVRGVDLEEVGRVRERGPRVAEASVFGDEPVVLARVRILPGAEEEHVLEEVRHAGALLGIVGAPHVDIERGRRLVGAGVGDQEGLESVSEGERAVVPGVGGASLDLEREGECGRGSGEEQRDRRTRERTERDRGSESGQ